MIEVAMTKYATGEGNCLTACVASLLECEIDDIPDFSSFGKDWHKRTSHYLDRHGFGTIFVPAAIIGSLIVGDCLCIAIFETDTPELHAKIGRWHSEWNGTEWRYSVDEVFDPNTFRNPVGDLKSVLLVFRKIEAAE